MVSSRSLVIHTLGVVVGLSALGTAQAGFIQIALPNSIYTSGTNLISTGVPSVNPIPSITGSGLTVSFSGASVFARTNVPTGWQTWSSPPFSETSTPTVDEFQTPLACSVCTVTLALSSAVNTFGFEAETDPLPNPHTLTVTFLDGATTVGTVTQVYTTGLSSARLIAGTTPDLPFTSVQITGDTDFAIANPRFSTTYLPLAGVPEPSTIALAFLGFCAIGFKKLRRA